MSVKIKELPISERPYEKLEMYGAEMLSNSELLAIIIKSGTHKESSVALAQKVLTLREDTMQEDLTFLQEISIEEFMKIKGIGKVKAIQLKATCELAKRMAKPINSKIQIIHSTNDIAKLFMDQMKYEKREIVKLIILNTKNIILKIKDISLGGTNFAVIEPKQVLVDAVKMQAAKIILVHNHPSGDPTPSHGDFLVTDRIYEAADVMGIQLLDHVIIGNNRFESVFSNKKGWKKDV